MPLMVRTDVTADILSGAKKFYSELLIGDFIALPGFPDYRLIESSGLEGKPSKGGGIGKRGSPDQSMHSIGIPEFDEYVIRVIRQRGLRGVLKMFVPGFGHPVIRTDTEGNPFGLCQDNHRAV